MARNDVRLPVGRLFGRVDPGRRDAAVERPAAADAPCVPKDGVIQRFADGGGRILTDVNVVLIFWGAGWADGSPTPSMNAARNAIDTVLSTAYLSALAQYHGIGASRVVATHVHRPHPPNPFEESDLAGMVLDNIVAGTVPFSVNQSFLYCGITLAGVGAQTSVPAVGFHSVFEVPVRIGNVPAFHPIYFAWVGNDGTLTSVNSIPKVFSHELAEACTDPDLGSGITVFDSCGAQGEISDVCNSNVTIVNGVGIGSYWSQHDHHCVTPLLYSVRWFFEVARKNPGNGLRHALPFPLPRVSVKAICHLIAPG